MRDVIDREAQDRRTAAILHLEERQAVESARADHARGLLAQARVDHDEELVILLGRAVVSTEDWIRQLDRELRIERGEGRAGEQSHRVMHEEIDDYLARTA